MLQTVQAGKQGSTLLNNLLRGSGCQPKMLYSVNKSLKNKGIMKLFLDRQNLK